jgi:hypothetical protein
LKEKIQRIRDGEEDDTIFDLSALFEYVENLGSGGGSDEKDLTSDIIDEMRAQYERDTHHVQVCISLPPTHIVYSQEKTKTKIKVEGSTGKKEQKIYIFLFG